MRSCSIAVLVLALGAGCVPFWPEEPEPALAPIGPDSAEPPPPSPAAAPPGPAGDSAVWWQALAADERRIVVSKEARRLWLEVGDSTLFSAPVAFGDTTFRYGDQEYDLSTPTGRHTVLGKEEEPEWVPPDWHYYELAVARDLEPVHLAQDTTVYVSDYTWILVREGEVGRVDRFGYWEAFEPGIVLAFDGKIFIPPLGSPQRRIPDILGTHRLIVGDGYLIHGTPLTDATGQVASCGCIRMHNQDIEVLYGMVDQGVPVYIY